MKSSAILTSFSALWLALTAAAPVLWPQSPLHQRYSSYWTTEESYDSTIELHNNLVNEALAVTPVLTTEDGAQVELDPVTMAALGSVSIPVRAALAAKGITAPARGSAVFRYNRKAGGALAAETSVIHARDSLAYTIPSAEEAPRSRTLWGFYWLRSPVSEVYIALQNISEETVEVTPRLRIGGAWFALAPASLAPGGSGVLEFPEDFDPSNLALARAWQEQRMGGIELAHNGPEGALNVSGWVADERLGYSNMTSFSGPPRGTKLFGTQVLLGKQEDLLGRRRGLQLNTELLLWNTSGQALAPAGTFYYESYGNVLGVALPLGTLAAGEIRHLDLSALQKQGLIPAAVSEGSLEIEHWGPEGALAGRVVSISRDGKYGLYTSLEDHGAGSFSGVYWSLREDWNSILTVMNVGDEEDRVTVELAYNGGTFVLPEFVLLPRQSRTLNLRKLLAEGLLDRNGNPFPEGVDHGGYLIYGSDRPLEARLMVKEHLVSQRLEVAAPFYQACNYVVLFFLSDASPVTLNIGQTHNIYPKCEMNNGSVYAESGSTQWSDYPSIASVSGTGTTRVITGLAPGLTSIDGETTEASDEFCTPILFRQDQPKDVTVPNPTLSCPATVTRGQSATASVNNLGTAAIRWDFLEGGPSGPVRVTNNGGSSWSGTVVTTGTVKATITPPSGSPIILQCTITVNNRNWHTQPASATSAANGTLVVGGQTLTLPVPPQPGADSGLGVYGWEANDSGGSPTIIQSGPNSGYAYFASSLTFSSFFFKYTINPDLENSSSTFSQKQYGACGYISWSDLRTQTHRHEYNHATASHHGKYVNAMNSAANNLGDFLEARVATPGADLTDFSNQTRSGLDARKGQIATSTAQEPPAVNQSAQGAFLGNINYAPYASCP